MNATDFTNLLKRVAAGETLDAETSARAFDAMMSGTLSDASIAAFLTALAVREATVEEIMGAARAMRSSMRTIQAPEGAIDLCGTGGDGHGTLNVSTATSFVVAACGVPVAKHGNRNMSSRCGAADVLEALGIRIDISPQAAESCLNEIGLCFLYAPNFHSAMRHVSSVRRELGFRTVFNILGPICNPARIKRQLLGVFSSRLVPPLASVLRGLGTEKAWVVHGADGLDELTTTDTTTVCALAGGTLKEFAVDPEEVGLPRARLDALKGGTAGENAKAIHELLNGDRGAFRDITLLNAGAALVIADKVADLRTGVVIAGQAIDSGAAKAALARLASATQKLAA
jgi:anthranilate phosphoribosyltransferase